MKIQLGMFGKQGRIQKVERKDAMVLLTIAVDGGGTALCELSPEDQNTLRPYLQPATGPLPRRPGT